MASPKISIGSTATLYKSKNKRRSKVKHLRHRKTLGPKSHMRGCRS